MGYLSTIRKLIAKADKLTKDVQVSVIYKAYVSETGNGDRTYRSPKSISAIVNWKSTQVRTSDGTLTVSRAVLSILDPTIVVDEKDVFILPDGTTGPILDLGGFIDRGTGHPVATTVYLG